MTNKRDNDPLLDMFIYESTQLLEQLEELILQCEKAGLYNPPAINEIFRIMHTIKGSSAVMSISSISTLAHSIEDMFYFLRENITPIADSSEISDLVLKSVDFIKVEIYKIENGDTPDGDCSDLLEEIRCCLELLKEAAVHNNEPDKASESSDGDSCSESASLSTNISTILYKAVIFFEEGCEMENVRAYTVLRNLKEFARDITYVPVDILEREETVNDIRKDGFCVSFRADKTYNEVYDYLMQTIFLEALELTILEASELQKDNTSDKDAVVQRDEDSTDNNKQVSSNSNSNITTEYQSMAQSIISVNVNKLDILMDLMGELVITEAMVTQNPELAGLELNSLNKALDQLHKITGEMQDMIMSIRMVSLSATFNKMHRVVRDMCKKLNKEVELILLGEDTEVDKNIIEHISDPMMHLVRNAVDHGIESADERVLAGKPEKGTIILESKNEGRNVLIIIKDNGRGLSKDAILHKAKTRGLLYKPVEELTDNEICNMILMPGFSTNDTVSEYSGRGVGMDVVVNNIEAIGGSVSISSTEGKGMTVTMQIPLTLAIIDGMNLRVGNSRYTIPTISIRESFQPKAGELIIDPDGNEMIMVRGECYPILRLNELFNVKTGITDISEGILIMAEQEGKAICLFADELLGQQQVVVKSLPAYIKNIKRIKGLSGCTLLGDGSISLILDIGGLVSMASIVKKINY